MKISFSSKGDFNAIENWLKKTSNMNASQLVKSVASEGTKNLSSKTPKDTGATASGWTEKITTTGNVTEVAWYNNAHPGESVNIAKLIELGHGTGTGGYVPPRPYIKEAMSPVWSGIDAKLIKELNK